MRLTSRSHNTSLLADSSVEHSTESLRPFSQNSYQFNKEVPKHVYIMRAITSNAPVSLAITDMPVDASLTLFAMNDLGPVNVTLPPTYQGPFSLKTTAPSFPQVLWPDASLKDPTGRGRPLVRGELGFDEHGAMKGEVRWGAPLRWALVSEVAW